MRRLVSGLTVFLVLLGAVAVDAAWGPATRIVSPSDQYVAAGVFSTMSGTLIAASSYGRSTAAPGEAFAAPAAWPGGDPAGQGYLPTDAALKPDGSGYLLWPIGSRYVVASRAADGTLGNPQKIFNLGGADIGLDAAGNATLTIAGSGGHVAVWTRGASDAAFTNQGDVSTGVGTLGNVFLTVDPNGAAVVTWQQGAAIKQATRAAGASTFGAPSDIAASGVPGPSQTGGFSAAANAAGRSVLIYQDESNGHYHAAVREPSGAFGTPADLGTYTVTGLAAATAAAVAPDGNAAVAGEDHTASTPCPGGSPFPNTDFMGIRFFTLPAGATTWTAAGTAGLAPGDNASYPALAAGAGARIDAAYWRDPATTAVACAGDSRSLTVAHGTVGQAPSDTLASVALPPKGTVTWTDTGFGAPLGFAVSSCGDAAIEFGFNPVGGTMGTAADHTADGVYVAADRGHCTGTSTPTPTPTVTVTAGPSPSPWPSAVPTVTPGTSPTPTPTTGPGPLTSPLPAARKRLTIKGRTGTVKVTNPNDVAITVTATLRGASSHRTVAPGGSASLTLKLSKRVVRALRKQSRPKAKLTLRVRASGRAPLVVTRTLALKLA